MTLLFAPNIWSRSPTSDSLRIPEVAAVRLYCYFTITITITVTVTVTFTVVLRRLFCLPRGVQFAFAVNDTFTVVLRRLFFLPRGVQFTFAVTVAFAFAVVLCMVGIPSQSRRALYHNVNTICDTCSLFLSSLLFFFSCLSLLPSWSHIVFLIFLLSFAYLAIVLHIFSRQFLYFIFRCGAYMNALLCCGLWSFPLVVLAFISVPCIYVSAFLCCDLFRLWCLQLFQ